MIPSDFTEYKDFISGCDFKRLDSISEANTSTIMKSNKRTQYFYALPTLVYEDKEIDLGDSSCNYTAFVVI